MDYKSIMGYANGSPYRNNPYLDIETPEGLITMEDTPIDLLGIDNTGHTQVMKAGEKNPYKFKGDTVREIPMKKGGYTEAQYNTIRGLKDAHDHGDFDNISPNKARKILHDKKLYGKPLTEDQRKLFGYLSKGNTLKYQQGGMTDLLSYLFEDDEEEKPQSGNTAPTTDDIENQQRVLDMRQKQIDEQEQYNLAMSIAMEQFGDNPNYGQYNSRRQRSEGNPYSGEAQSGFRAFPTYQAGRKALEYQLDLYKTGKTKNPVKPSSSLLEAMSVYAPASDNNDPQGYARFIANRLGITTTTPISQIPTSKWADAIEIMEGNSKGNNPGNLRF